MSKPGLTLSSKRVSCKRKICACEGEIERHTMRDRQTETDREREAYRQKDRETERDRERL